MRKEPQEESQRRNDAKEDCPVLNLSFSLSLLLRKDRSNSSLDVVALSDYQPTNELIFKGNTVVSSICDVRMVILVIYLSGCDKFDWKN